MHLAKAAAPGFYLATGPSFLPGWALSALAPALISGERVFWVDAGNSFAAYHLGRTARSLGADPREVLSRILFARPFTVFQLEAMICQKLPAAVGRELVVLSDPLALFCHEELSPAVCDAWRVFRRVLEGIRCLHVPLLVLAVARKAAAAQKSAREHPRYMRELLREAKAAANLESFGGFWRLTDRAFSRHAGSLKTASLGLAQRPRGGEALRGEHLA